VCSSAYSSICGSTIKAKLAEEATVSALG
jgi:hypothetical protein